MNLSKNAAKKRAKEIKQKYAVGELIDCANDLAILEHIFSMHPNREKKIGRGIKGFCVHEVDWGGKKNLCFAVVRTSGPEKDRIQTFSINECLQPSTHRTNVQHAFRVAVHDQIMAFWEEYKNKTLEKDRICPITLDLITEDNRNVDHFGENLFVDIFEQFVKLNDVIIENIELEPIYDTPGSISQPKDKMLRRDFSEFHRERAELRALTNRGNSLVNTRRAKHVDIPKGMTKEILDSLVGIRRRFLIKNPEYIKLRDEGYIEHHLKSVAIEAWTEKKRIEERAVEKAYSEFSGDNGELELAIRLAAMDACEYVTREILCREEICLQN